LSIRPPHNKLITGTTSLAKGVYPERNEGGQAPSMKEGEFTKVLALSERRIFKKGTGRTSFVSLRTSSQRFSSAQEIKI
jgi:hypothetical protein